MVIFYPLFKLLIRIENRLITLTTLIQLIIDHQKNLQQLPLQDMWLDNQDVMQKLRISESTLRRRRLEGTIRSTRIKGKYYYKESDIQSALRREWDQR